MASHEIDLNEAETHLSDWIDAAIKGEEVFITRQDRPVAQLIPVAGEKRRPQFGSAKGMIRMSPDFDAPLEEFREYME